MATKNVQKSISLNKFVAESDFGVQNILTASTMPYSITASNMVDCVPTNQTSIELKPRNKNSNICKLILFSIVLNGFITSRAMLNDIL